MLLLPRLVTRLDHFHPPALSVRPYIQNTLFFAYVIVLFMCIVFVFLPVILSARPYVQNPSFEYLEYRFVALCKATGTPHVAVLPTRPYTPRLLFILAVLLS